MLRILIILALALLPLSTEAAGPLPSTSQPSIISLTAKNQPVESLVEGFSRQAHAELPLTPPDLLRQTPLPPASIDIDHASFWGAAEELSRKTGLEPIVMAGDAFPRFQLGLDPRGFWAAPHVVAGPLLIVAEDVQRSNVVELRKKKHEFERELTVNLTAFCEPGLRVLIASTEVTVKTAVDEAGRSLVPAAIDVHDDKEPLDVDAGPPGSLFTWSLPIALNAPAGPSKKIARLVGVTHLRVQTQSQLVEVEDVLKKRNVIQTVAGVPFTFVGAKKEDNDYVCQLALRRARAPRNDWRNLNQSIINAQMALYDEQGRLVTARAVQSGNDAGEKRSQATLRFVREPGAGDPAAGEPYKLVWYAPTQSKVMPIEFELKNLPIPE